MPSPGDHELASPIFEAIWRVVKSWDIAIPGRYHGYCGANGSHALLILQGIKSAGVSLENLQDDAVQKMHAEVLQLKAENKSLHSEKHTVECRFEVSDDTLSTIRGCLRSAEGDIDKLKAENEALRNDLESHKRMLLAAACDIGAIGEALGADMDDDGSAIEGLAQDLRQKAECVDDCAHLIRKLVHCRRQLATDEGLAEKALDYLKRKGLQGNPLRADEVPHD